MALQCHMKEKVTITYFLKIVLTLVGVNNSDSFIVKTQTGLLKSSAFSTQPG